MTLRRSLAALPGDGTIDSGSAKGFQDSLRSRTATPAHGFRKEDSRFHGPIGSMISPLAIRRGNSLPDISEGLIEALTDACWEATGCLQPLSLVATLVALRRGATEPEEHQLRQPGTSLQAEPAGVVHRKQRLGPSTVPSVPNRRVE